MTVMDLGTARARAESLMTSTCTIRARGTETTTDPETGEVVPVAGTQRYSGSCRVRPASGAGSNSSEITFPGAEGFRFDYLISVPFSVSGVVESDRVTITASPDPALVGVEVEVQHVDRGEHITARRLACQEVA